MFKIIDKNDSGKTRKLLEECSKNGGVFVCKHPERIEEKCIAYSIPVVRAIGYLDAEELIINKAFNDNYKIYIDELEEFSCFILPNIGGWCLTYEKD